MGANTLGLLAVNKVTVFPRDGIAIGCVVSPDDPPPGPCGTPEYSGWCGPIDVGCVVSPGDPPLDPWATPEYRVWCGPIVNGPIPLAMMVVIPVTGNDAAVVITGRLGETVRYCAAVDNSTLSGVVCGEAIQTAEAQ